MQRGCEVHFTIRLVCRKGVPHVWPGLPDMGLSTHVHASHQTHTRLPTLLGVPKNLKRYYGSGDLHFITCSCCHRQRLLGAPHLRDLFLKALEQMRTRYRFVVLGYVVMPEHFHLLISEPQQGTPSTAMLEIKLGFARRVIGSGGAPCLAGFARHGDSNRIWERRFYDFTVWTERKRIEKHALHASKSGEARLGARAGSVALEQLPFVCLRRSWTGCDQRMENPADENPSARGLIMSTGIAPTSGKTGQTWGTPLDRSVPLT